MPLDIDDDEHVAKLLAQDAKKTTKTYSLVGLDAFNPKRCVGSLSILPLSQVVANVTGCSLCIIRSQLTYC
jgi:hypothetical protein